MCDGTKVVIRCGALTVQRCLNVRDAIHACRPRCTIFVTSGSAQVRTRSEYGGVRQILESIDIVEVVGFRREGWGGENGRGDWIRTSDHLNPIQVRYQAALRPDPVCK